MGAKNEKIIDSIQYFLLSKKLIRFENTQFIWNHRKYLKCGTKFYKKSISRLQIIEFIQ